MVKVYLKKKNFCFQQNICFYISIWWPIKAEICSLLKINSVFKINCCCICSQFTDVYITAKLQAIKIPVVYACIQFASYNKVPEVQPNAKYLYFKCFSEERAI